MASRNSTAAMRRKPQAHRVGSATIERALILAPLQLPQGEDFLGACRRNTQNVKKHEKRAFDAGR
jgi:hypothetical protein